MDGHPLQSIGGSTAEALQGAEGQTHLVVLHHILGTAALAQLDGQKLVPAAQHLVDQLQADQHILVLGVLFLFQAALDRFHVGARHGSTANGGFVVDIVAAHGKVHRIEGLRLVDLVPHQPDGTHQVGHSMGLGEHILDLAAALDIPVRHLMLPHGFLPARLEAALGHLALTHGLHDIKGHLGLQPLAQQVQHDAVTAADDLCNGAGAAADQLVRVARPHVRTVGQTGDLDQL